MANMDNDKLLEDIVAFLDSSVSGGTGHLNVEVNSLADEDVSRSVDTLGCIDCAKGNLACRVPTIDDAIDEQLNKQ